MRPGSWLTRLSVYFDNTGIDGLVRSVAALVGGTSGWLRRWMQTGYVRSYALFMFGGAAVLVALLLVVRL
jgi:NADH-quinone oxidoreductase subunit L